MKDNQLTKVIKQKAMGEIIGINASTISRIFSQKQNCSKLVAYCITKFIDKDKEITDFEINCPLEEKYRVMEKYKL